MAAAGPEPLPSHILISLKALRLTDAVVLAGLAPFLASRQERDIALTIARFYPPEQEWTADLAKDLDIPAAGQESRGRIQAVPGSRGPGRLPPATPREASLVISEYLIRDLLIPAPGFSNVPRGTFRFRHFPDPDQCSTWNISHFPHGAS